ncbi:uncharacterized protein LOC124167986 isoform X2 [Ischnura elegans]|uniref:uncharacterized protein LOC124167986 isoform X2 n=1 Tax=Ischnura elegans TaxID=197161 RepID=UPI001ED86B44|nr:uncharacterized protein LOC124167986 isoform X2 [Ischnura elegans]
MVPARILVVVILLYFVGNSASLILHTLSGTDGLKHVQSLVKKWNITVGERMEEGDNSLSGAGFRLKDKYYFIHNNYKNTWQGAGNACRLLHISGHRAALDTMEKVAFITEVLKQNPDLDLAIWIDGKNDGRRWYWDGTGEVIPLKREQGEYPPWDLLPTFHSAQCLRLQVPFSQCSTCTVLFDEHECTDELGFLCEADVYEHGIENIPMPDGLDDALDPLITVQRYVEPSNPQYKHVNFTEPILLIPDDDFLGLIGDNAGPLHVDFSLSRTSLDNSSIDDVSDEEPLGRDERSPIIQASLFSKELNSEEPIKIERNGVNGGTTFLHQNKSFTFFINRKASWEKARELCPKLAPGSHLAELDSKHLAYFIAVVMTKHQNDTCDDCDLWIGGEYNGTDWEWHQSKDLILSKRGPEGYPPWGPGLPEPHHDCLSIRKVFNAPEILFRGRQCDAPLGFICQEKDVPYLKNAAARPNTSVDAFVGDGFEKIDNIVHLEGSFVTNEWVSEESTVMERDRDNGGTTFVHQKISYTFFMNRKASWEKAKELCPKLAPGSHLATLYSEPMAYIIALSMTEHPNDTCDDCDLWIGGEYNGANWVWHLSEDIIPPKRDGDGYPPWGPVLSEPHHDCLSIRKVFNSSEILFRGIQCDDPLPFICQRKDVSILGNAAAKPNALVRKESLEKDNIMRREATVFSPHHETPVESDYDVKGGISYEYHNNSFIFFPRKKVTWFEARSLCEELVPGSLLAALDYKFLAQATAYILNEYPEVGCEYCDLWVDGYYNGIQWLWNEQRYRIQAKEGPNGYPHWAKDLPAFHHNCLSIRESEEAPEPYTLRFRGIQCESRIGFLCRKQN